MLIISEISSKRLLPLANRHAPVMHERVRWVDNCPCLNSDIKRDMRECDYFLMKARKTRLSENWTKYRYIRNRVTGKIKKA